MAEPFNPLQVGDPNGDGNPLYAGSPTLADAWRFNANATQDWLDQQRAISAQRGLWNPETGLPTQAGLIDAAQQYGSGVMMGTTAPGDVPVPGIRAFHGSPHSFDRFDTANIGTGEGAQAYGHGLYFADREGTAQAYRDALRDNPVDIAFKGQRFDPMQRAEGMTQEEFSALQRFHDEKALTPADAISRWQDRLKFTNPGSYQRDILQSDIASLGAMKDEMSVKPAGHMYEVNIAANPEHFLDWDKPLREQTPHVQDAYLKARFGGDAEEIAAARKSAEYMWRSPMALLSDLAHPSVTGSYPGASEALREAGIPGIRYLDAGSRAPTQAVTPIRNQLEQARLDLQHWQDAATNPRQEEVRQKSLLAFEKPGSSWADAVAAKQQRVEDLQRSLDDAVQAAKGTHNHVVFDADTIAILRKYGIAGLMAGAGGVAAASQAQAAPPAPPASTPWHSRWNDVLQRYGYSTIPTP